MLKIQTALDLPPDQLDAALRQLMDGLGFCPAWGGIAALKREMQRSRPGALPQFLFSWEDGKWTGYLFLIAQRERSNRALPWWAAHNADVLPRRTALPLMRAGLAVCRACGASALEERLKRDPAFCGAEREDEAP